MNELEVIKQEMTKHIIDVMRSVSNMGTVVSNINEKILKLETSIQTRVYISSVHANMIKREISKRVHYLTEYYKADYKATSKKLYSALYRSIHDKYSIADYREIPDIEFENVLEFIKYWDNQHLLTNLKSA